MFFSLTNERSRRWRGVRVGLLLALSMGGNGPAWAGHLEDLLLEKGQITIDEWVELKAEEERRESKKFEESRSVGDTPLTAKWYEKISVRGYAQVRWNRIGRPNGALLNAQGGRAISDNRGFFFRVARLILSGQPHDRLFIYLQPDFATVLNDTTGGFVQIRDWYADIFLTEDKEWRIRAGQSKVPYGFENMQSTQNRLALDRADPLNSAVLGERDFGFFLYYAPTYVRARFRKLVESGLKGSGDYGMLGVGVYNGQTANRIELNDNKHVILRAAYPFELPTGQIVEVGVSAYHGKYVISKTAIVPEGGGAATTPAGGTTFLDERVGGYFVIYPQPFGIQGEYTFGHGPRLSEDRRSISTRPLYGGYIQAMYNYKCPAYCLSVWPFIRYQEYLGGRKHEPNAPSHRVRELEIGMELQLNPNLELTASYSWTDRTASFVTERDPEPYKSYAGNLIRFQLQFNY